MLGGTEETPRRTENLVDLTDWGLLGFLVVGAFCLGLLVFCFLFFSKVFSKCANKEPGKEEEAARVSLVFVLSRFSRPLFAGHSSVYHCVQLPAAKL